MEIMGQWNGKYDGMHYFAILLLSVFLTLLMAVMLCFTRKCWARSEQEEEMHKNPVFRTIKHHYTFLVVYKLPETPFSVNTRSGFNSMMSLQIF